MTSYSVDDSVPRHGVIKGAHTRWALGALLILGAVWYGACGRDPVDPPNQPPVASVVIPAQTVNVGDTARVDLTRYFSDPDGDSLKFAAETSDGGVVVVSVSGDVMSLSGVSPGQATVTVAATDPDGLSARQNVAATVPNRAPETAGSIPALEVFAGESQGVEVTPYFTDPDGEALVYSAATADEAVATVEVSRDSVVVSGVRQGQVTITVTATDPGGLSARQSFEATVPNRSPRAVDSIPALELFRGGSQRVGLSRYFADPDGDALAFAAETTDSGVAGVVVSGDSLAVSARSQGTATVTVTATDPDGLSAAQDFTVTVPNRAPVPTDSIPALVLFKEDYGGFDASRHFADPDEDALAYTVRTSDAGVAVATVFGDSVTVTAVSQGLATVTVTATDPGGLSAEQSLGVNVPNRAPVGVDSIPALELFRGEAGWVDVAGYFADPDEDALSHAAETSAAAVAAVRVSGDSVIVSAVAQGRATVTVRATDPGGLSAEQRFAVEVPNRAPVVVDAIPGLEVFAGDSGAVNLSRHFADPDGDSLAFAAETTDATVAAVAVAGGVVTVMGVSQGRASVTVRAGDPGGLTAEQRFAVTVPNRAPVRTDSIPPLELFKGGRDGLDASRHFADPDEDALTYTVRTSDTGVATARVSGDSVTVSAVSQGRATLTVTATDPGGLSAAQSLVVNVPNRPPVGMDSIPALELFRGDAGGVEVPVYFADPDDDRLGYAVATSDTAVATTRMSGDSVIVSAAAQGKATVTVTATDPGGLSAEQRFAVTVPNRAPAVSDTIPRLEVFIGDSGAVRLSGHFTDPDGDPLAFAAETSDARVVAVSVAGAVATVSGVAKGKATVTVTATDPAGLSARQRFEVAVPNRAPVATDPIPALELHLGDREETDLARHFADPDGDSLDYTAQSSDTAVAAAAATGSSVTVSAVSQGLAIVTVTATDPDGLSARQSFAVSTPNRAPAAVGSIPALELYSGESGGGSVPGYFTDPDGDTLSYSVETSDAAVAAVELSGDSMTVSAVAPGEADVTVTATDPGGLSAEQSFPVAVPNRAPVVSDTIHEWDIFPGELGALDLSQHFTDPDGESLAFAAETSDTAVATVTVEGPFLELAAVARGQTTVTVTASDRGGLSASQNFPATVRNQPPEPIDSIPPVDYRPGDTHTIAVAKYFSDPDGDSLSYDAATSDAAVAAVEFSDDSTVTVTGVAGGEATVTVTATDPGELFAIQDFPVTVRNQPPEPVGSIPPVELRPGASHSIMAANYFSDPDGDELSYRAETTDAAVAAVEFSDDSTVTVAGVAGGDATVTITAADGGGLSAEQQVEVTVENRAPVAVGSVPDAEVLLDAGVTVDVSEYFSDPDGDPLSYEAGTSDSEVATASVSLAEVTVAGVAVGTVTVTVTAKDAGELTAEQRFGVVVDSAKPTTVVVSPDSARLNRDETVQLSATVFDQLGREMEDVDVSWTSDDPGVATVSSSGLVTAEGGGNTTVTATAGDAQGAARVTVRQPVDRVYVRPTSAAVSSTGDLLLRARALDDNRNELDVSFQWKSSDPSAASVDPSGVVSGESTGSATVTVSAGGKEATSEITVVSANSQRDALTSLYGATDGATWKENENWVTAAPLRDWHGVTASRSDTVTLLWLLQNDMNGPLPSELGSLTNLTQLIVTDAKGVTGPIPTSLARLSELDELNLSGLGLTGTIPPELAQLDKLTGLFLSDLQLSGSIPPEFGDFAALAELEIAGTSIAGSIPPELGQLDSLLILEISETSVSGVIPPEIGDLSTLEYLSLAENDLTGAIPSELGQLDSLWNLDFQKNDLTGAVPAELGQLGNLTDLDLSENSGLAGPLPTALSALTLEWLDLRGTDLCVPTEMEDWLNGIDTAHAELCDDGQDDVEP